MIHLEPLFGDAPMISLKKVGTDQTNPTFGGPKKAVLEGAII